MPLTRRQQRLADDYKPVDWPPLQTGELRLIQLLPGVGTETLSCQLLTYRYEESEGRYIALSYAWGSNELCKTIVCNGHIVRITNNLHSALRRCRDPTSSHAHLV